MSASRAIACIAVFFFCFIACGKPAPTVSKVPPAFPGAEGFGADTHGGRGGRVIKVTNLNTSGPGSFQEACSAEGPRIIVFGVSGVIPGDVMIEHGQISIFGQTAPGAGITVRGMLKTPNDTTIGNLEDIVVRFVRVRPPSMTGDQADALQFNRVRRAVIDHCSVSWSTDECLGLFCARDLTVQWCDIEESDVVGHWKGVHNYGLLSGPEGAHLTVHHNLFAHHGRRCPAIANAPADVVNNVVYNFRDGFLHDNPTNDSTFNIVGNYYKAGPSSRSIYPFCFDDSASYYLRDNYIHTVGLVQDPWAEKDRHPGLAAYADKGRKAGQPSACPPVTTQMPEEAYRLVLASAGCLPRDAVSLRTVADVRDSTGSWGRHEPADLLEGLVPSEPPVDTDNDGMPDDWEEAKGLDPKDGSDCSKVMEHGYTAIEVYADELARKLIAGSQTVQ